MEPKPINNIAEGTRPLSKKGIVQTVAMAGIAIAAVLVLKKVLK
jgi:hypothetical protein|tara:strand:- start:63010 stop:63141 length:132 start_codon:yes stop_codon:yes gene_type:complete